MSLASPYQEHYYVADGVTTSFSFGEYFTGLSQAYVKCIIYFDDGTNCVPTFTVDMTTGFITIVTLTKPDGTVLTVPPAGSIVRVFRDTPEQQNVTASQLQNYTAKQLERIFDSVVAMIQEVSYSDLHKTIRLTETQRDVSMEQLKEENDQAILYWDFETKQLKATDYGQNQVVKSDTVDRLVYLQPEGKIYFIPKGSNNPIAIGSATIHNDLGGRNAPNCHPESAITGLREHLQELRDKDSEIEEDVQIALNRSQEAKDTADEAKGTAEYAQTIAEDAKDIAEDAKETAEGIEDIAEEAKNTADEAKGIAEDAKETAEGIDEKAQTALDNSEEALDKVTQEITDRQDADDALQDQITDNKGAIEDHVADTNNPHSVTKAQVGLGNVDNTSDLNKPISTATQTALNTKANIADLATVATSGSYNDLSDKPTIPTVNNPTITITQGGVTKGSFTLNQATGDTIALDAGGGSIDAIDGVTITKNSDDEIQAVATINTNTAAGATNPIYDWVGTLAEYNAQNIESLHPGWMCYITDDVSGGDSVYTKSEVDTIVDGKANTDLSNLTSVGQNISNWSSNVTNCITEIPQDIKLELNNGTLTLKAGSKVYVPNGVGVFDELIIQNDLTTISTWGEQVQLGLFVKSDGSTMFIIDMAGRCSSGSTPPAATNYQMWYDTTNNLVKGYRGGSDTGNRYSLPIALVQKGDSLESSNISGIDQVFNGFGYIGSTVFALPGVKGLIPDGRNADGSLKNIATEVISVQTFTYTDNNNTGIYAGITPSGTIKLNGQKNYNEIENFIYNGYDLELVCEFAVYTNPSGKIADFTLKTVFHAVDYTDYITSYLDFTKNSGTIVAEQLPTAANNYTWYRRYKNGWVEQGGMQTGSLAVNYGSEANFGTITLPVPMANTLYFATASCDGYVYLINQAKTTTQYIPKLGAYTTNRTATYCTWYICGMAAS